MPCFVFFFHLRTMITIATVATSTTTKAVVTTAATIALALLTPVRSVAAAVVNVPESEHGC